MKKGILRREIKIFKNIFNLLSIKHYKKFSLIKYKTHKEIVFVKNNKKIEKLCVKLNIFAAKRQIFEKRATPVRAGVVLNTPLVL